MSETSATPVVTIATIGQHEGKTVTLRGWLYNIRSSGKLLFPTFRDGTGTIQGIVPRAAVPEQVFETLKGLQLESSLTVTGKVRADSRAPSGYELDVENIHVLSAVSPDDPFPITLKEHGVDFLMEHRHLWLRTPRQSAILRVRATIMRAAAEYFDTHGFVRTDPPILTPNACEGTSELFEMDYFDDDKAYLTQSGQLYIEATALALGKVYSFGPTFRAEKSKTRRHLTEFWMIEPEVAFLELDGLMDLAEAFITHIVTRVLEQHRADLKVIGRDVAKLEAVVAHSGNAPESVILSEAKNPRISSEAPQTPTETNQSVILSEGAAEVEGSAVKTAANRFPRLSYEEAHAMLEKAYAEGKLENPHKYGDDFGSPDETYISSQFDKPVMVHRYPAAIKAFYMQPDPHDPTKALCVDVLAPEGYGEIIGGSQRVDSYDLLRQRIEDHNLPLAAFQWYLDLRKYGSVPHAGFGMGIERAVAWICGLDHVRETIPFARTLNRIYP
ncbi:asparagine--tRNA ligase [Edaphobacter sp. 12200R-103]|uniref:asparagine--tRNA ligase n=1 Tax=Edaphobacter sp. 12200R-103 TaxID=2703788 RepID=UPI00138D620A|nr:asparagine--tRNA ligase [Edaphobacter sp. 12200R-103]QHS52856.1 asparagine--tRNA ligase [Edaphobacter sp. 12200R-103]